jgi:hypothetical protein
MFVVQSLPAARESRPRGTENRIGQPVQAVADDAVFPLDGKPPARMDSIVASYSTPQNRIALAASYVGIGCRQITALLSPAATLRTMASRPFGVREHSCGCSSGLSVEY